jgi:trimethylamine:corrinoid methyltransferase-like protein
VQTDTLATALFAGINFKADFLKQKATRQLFPKEQHLPSKVIDRGSLRGWQEQGRLDAFARARSRVAELLAAYQPPQHDEAQVVELRRMVAVLASQAGMEKLPAI